MTILEVEPVPTVEIDETDLAVVAAAFGDLADIKMQWLSAQRAETKRELFTAMRAHYEIVLPKPFSTPSGPGVAVAAPAPDTGGN